MSAIYTEKRLVLYAQRVGSRRKQYTFADAAHGIFANQIAKIFFNGNFRTKPTTRSVYNFAKTYPNKDQIINFLSNRNMQQRFNEL